MGQRLFMRRRAMVSVGDVEQWTHTEDGASALSLIPNHSTHCGVLEIGVSRRSNYTDSIDQPQRVKSTKNVVQ